MIRFGTTLQADQVLTTDICIIGGGPAGITLALSLEHTSRSILLLESGGLEPDDQSRDLNSGEVRGWLESHGSYLTDTRARGLGGTSNLWSGTCGRFDASDFDPRPWLVQASWPLELSELAPYYETAALFCEVPGLKQSASNIENVLGISSEHFQTRILYKSPPTRFGTRFRDRLRSSRNIDVCLGATATELHLNSLDGRVGKVAISSANGTRAKVTARYVILATGAIENSRLLLCSKSEVSEGLGNSYGLVGRYFMEHPYMALGTLSTQLPGNHLTLAGVKNEHAISDSFGILSTTRSFQRERGLTCMRYHLRQVGPAVKTPPDNMFDSETFVSLLDQSWTSASTTQTATFSFSSVLEPQPQVDSMVELSGDRDRLGMQRVRLTSKLSNNDLRSLCESTKALIGEIGKSLQVRMKLRHGLLREVLDTEIDISRFSHGGHHIGTTRMGATAKEGVVDKNCKVFGIENLFVAGSSLFPTATTINPTATIVAFAARLADHLVKMLDAERSW